MKKLLLGASAVVLFACGSNASDVTLFFMPGCPHCHEATNFLDKLDGVSVEKIDITKGGANMEKFSKQLSKCGLTSRGVPLLVINGECLQGFGPDTGKEIRQKLGK